MPIARFVNNRIFALTGGGYGCLFSLAGIDDEGMTDQELEAQMRSIEGALRGLPEGSSCLYQYTRVLSGCDLPRKAHCTNPVTQVFVDDRLAFLEKTAGFRRIDLHWCLTLEPPKAAAFAQKPQEHAVDTTRMLTDLERTPTLLEGHLDGSIGLRFLHKNAVYPFFSYLFNLEEWAAKDTLSADNGVDRQIVKSPVAWHSDHLTIGRRYVQVFSLKTTPEASRPCFFSGLMTLDCDSVLCTMWRPKSSAKSVCIMFTLANECLLVTSALRRFTCRMRHFSDSVNCTELDRAGKSIERCLVHLPCRCAKAALGTSRIRSTE